MGFFDIFKKKEEVIKEPAKIDEEDIELEDIVPRIDEMLASGMEAAKNNVGEANKKIRERMIEIKESARKMEDAYFEKSDKTYTRINMVKDGWLKRLLSSLNSLPSLSEVTYQNIDNYISEVQALINNATKTDPKQNYILSNYFKSEMKNIVLSITKISQGIESLRKEISDKSPLKVYGELSEMADELRAKRKDLSKLDDGIKKRKSEIKELESMREEREKNLKDAGNDPEMLRLINLKKSISGIEKDLSDTKLRLSEDLNLINRPLKKIKHGMGTGESRFISEFLSSPVDICLSEGGEAKVENIIRIVSKHADNDDVGLSEKDAKKIASFAEKIKSGGIREIKNRIIEKTSSLENMQNEIKGLKKLEERQKSIQNDIETISLEKERVEKDLERNMKELEFLNEEISSLKEKIADYTEKNIGIRFNVLHS